MAYRGTNPKSEIRNPKPERSPKSEARNIEACAPGGLYFEDEDENEEEDEAVTGSASIRVHSCPFVVVLPPPLPAPLLRERLQLPARREGLLRVIPGSGLADNAHGPDLDGSAEP